MSEPTEELTGEDAASQAQQELLESCLELVFDTYDEAVAEKVLGPVVFLVDCEDEVGEQIATGWLGAETVRDVVAEQRLDDPAGDLTTAYARAVPIAQCRKQVPEIFPYLAPIFDEEPPVGGFLAIAVTSGGASVFTVPLSAREEK